jgi:hypothetical protein
LSEEPYHLVGIKSTEAQVGVTVCQKRDRAPSRFSAHVYPGLLQAAAGLTNSLIVRDVEATLAALEAHLYVGHHCRYLLGAVVTDQADMVARPDLMQPLMEIAVHDANPP